jgi:hypothetical protein
MARRRRYPDSAAAHRIARLCRQRPSFGAIALGEPGSIEMHAVDLRTDPPVTHIAAVAQRERGDIEYRCACELAAMVGIDPEEG